MLIAESFSHLSPIAPVLFGIVVIILSARLGGHLFESIGQPSVLGELVIGVLLGNLTLVGVSQLEFLRVEWTHETLVSLSDTEHCAGIAINAIAQLGVLFLMFQVGMENSVTRMRRVGLSAFCVAVLGVVAPFLIGWGSAHILLPSAGWAVHVFLGTALCATSVGITARVFDDLGRADSTESQIVLGAAVIDDVLGLIVLSVVHGLIMVAGSEITEAGPAGSGIDAMAMVTIVAKAFGFLVLAILLGPYVSRPIFHVASFLRGRGLLISSALTICFGFAWVSALAGLAPIVGAFAAGLILEDAQYRELSEQGERPLHELLRPIADFVVPIFFVMMGFRVDLASLVDTRVLGLAAMLSLAAIAGKLVCGLGVRQPGVNRLAVGVGMIPRGEVGLIFAGIGLSMLLNGRPLLDSSTYSALVVTVMVTTLVTPPLLKWALCRCEPASSA